MKKYKKPSFLRVFVQLILAAAVYAGALFGMKYFLPEFDFFGSYLGYVLAVVLVFSIVLNIFTRGIVYRASQGKTSKFLIFVHSLLLLIYLAFKVYASYHYLKDSLFKDNMYYLYILAGVVGLVYLINVIVLGSRSAKIRRQALALAETPVEVVETTIEPVVESPVNDEVLPVEETPSTKKEIKVAKKEAKKAAKLAKKNDKKAKVIAKERKLIEKKLGKKEAKINKKIAKVEKQIAKKLAKLEKKQANN